MRFLLWMLLTTGMAAGQPLPRFSFGVKGGATVNGSFGDSARYDQTGRNASAPFFSTYSARDKIYLVGPTVEVRLPLRLSVELDALFSRFNAESYYTTTPSDASSVSTVSFANSSTANRWDFPLLVKYHLPLAPGLRPFVSGGVSFAMTAQDHGRYSQIVSIPSSGLQAFSGQSDDRVRYRGAGLVVGGGVSFGVSRFQITPELRYERRQQSYYTLPIRQDQVQFLIGISFGR